MPIGRGYCKPPWLGWNLDADSAKSVPGAILPLSKSTVVHLVLRELWYLKFPSAIGTLTMRRASAGFPKPLETVADVTSALTILVKVSFSFSSKGWSTKLEKAHDHVGPA